MSLIDKISSEELDMYREYAAVCSCGKNESVSNEHIFRCWNNNKQNLYQVLGNNFIISKEVSYERPQRALEDDIIENLIKSDCSLIRKVRGISEEYHHKRWRCSDPELRTYYDNVSYLFSVLTYAEVLAKNKYNRGTIVLNKEFTPTKKNIKIQQGMKATRALELLTKAYGIFDKNEFEDFRIKHSQCLNNKIYKGTLCLSIHPLDYATMSDNTCDWSSCMSWVDDGDYKQGTVEMMNSPYMVVAYLTSSAQYNLCVGDDTMWNSKKWRKLYAVTPDLIMGIKAYPYAAEDLDRICLDWLRELASSVEGYGPYETKPHKTQNHRTTYIDERTVFLNMNHMYSDISHGHLAYFKKNLKYKPEYCLSGESECLICGRTGKEFIEHNALDCHDCGDYCTCECCGNSYRWNDESFRRGPNGNYICEYCYDEYLTNCGSCDELAYIEDTCEDIGYRDLCPRCYDKYKPYLTENEYGDLLQLNLLDLPSADLIDNFFFYDSQRFREAWEEYHASNKKDLDLKN